MIFKKLSKILWLTTIVTLWMLANAKTGVSRMKALVLYAQFPMKSITNSLKSYNIDYQEWDVTKLTPNEKLTPKLYDDGKRPIYYMIIVDGSLEIYNTKSQAWESVLSLNQWKELHEYEVINHARRVVVNNFTKPKVEGQYINYDEKQMITQSLVSAHNDYSLKVFNDARVKRSAPLTSEGLIHSGLEYTKDKGIIPILFFLPTKSITKKTLAAAILDQGDGREIFSFFIQFTEDSLTSTMLNHLWITWASRNLIPGHRRVFFTPQIENVFLNTRIVNENLEEIGITVDNFEDALSKKYRASPYDYEKLIEFTKELNKNGDMNVGSKLQIELAFNGDGIYQNIEASKDVKKRSTEGTPIAIISNKILQANDRTEKSEKDILIEEISKYWKLRQETLSKDELFNFFSNINHRKEFNWVSNTYSNEIFVNITRTEIRDEILNNLEVAVHLGLINKELSNSEMWWSKGSIGTRGSLGFTDETVIQTLKDYNIHYGLGNRHREDIINHDDDNLPFTSPYGDFYVIPRDKRLALRWASSPLQTIWLYKKFYKDDYFADDEKSNTSKDKNENISDWLKILDIESEDAVQSLLNLKHDPIVFNQSNIKDHNSKPKENNSIMAQWLIATIQKYNAYVYWPMISSKSDNLARYYVGRATQKECGVEYSYSHNETHIIGIQIISQKACRVPITVAETIVKDPFDTAFTYEQYGTDPLTVWIDLPGDGITKTITLEPALSYCDRSFIHLPGETDFDDNIDEEVDVNPEEKILDEVNNTEQTKQNVKNVKPAPVSSSKPALISSSKPTPNPTPTPTPVSKSSNLKTNMEKILNSRSNNNDILNGKYKHINHKSSESNLHKRQEMTDHHHHPSPEEFEEIIKNHRPDYEAMREKFKNKDYSEKHIEALKHMLDHISKLDDPRHKAFEKMLKAELAKEQQLVNDEDDLSKRGVRHRRSRIEKNHIRRGGRHRRSEIVEDINPSFYISQLESIKNAREAMNNKLMYINDNFLKKVKHYPNDIEEHADDQYRNY